MSDQRQIVIIGGGIIGLASAHYLRQSGLGVTVVDKGRVGGECSHGNCGLICPSHILPLAEPGAVGSTLRALLKPNGPFRIRPRLDRHLWGWLWRFSRRCNERDMLESGRAIQPLLESSRQLYSELLESESLSCQWRQQGLLYVYRSQRALDAFSHVNELLREHFQAPAQRLSGAELTDFEPSLRDGLAGAWYYQRDAHLRPDRLVASWRALLESRGVKFIEGESLEALVDYGGVVSAAELGSRTLRADLFLIAAGAWTPQLERTLRWRAPIEPGKGYSVTMPRPASHCPAAPMLFPEHRVAVTPLDDALRLGSIMEFAGYDKTIHPRRLKLLRAGAVRYLRCELPDHDSEAWCGWRPMTHDSTPIIGACPGFANVYLATGHNMLGLSMAPATGRLISELICGAAPHVSPAPYAPDRFGK